jgi:hypothetical protein
MPKVATKSADSSVKLVGDADVFKIEDGIPLPVTVRPNARRHFPFDQLKSGQSFLVAKDKRKGLKPAVAAYYKANPSERKTIVVREQEGEAVRVWKK